MIDEQLRQELRDPVQPPSHGGVFLFDGNLLGPQPTAVRDDFTIGYRCTEFWFDLTTPLNKAANLFVGGDYHAIRASA
jgi:hypothetical protein